MARRRLELIISFFPGRRRRGLCGGLLHDCRVERRLLHRPEGLRLHAKQTSRANQCSDQPSNQPSNRASNQARRDDSKKTNLRPDRADTRQRSRPDERTRHGWRRRRWCCHCSHSLRCPRCCARCHAQKQVNSRFFETSCSLSV